MDIKDNPASDDVCPFLGLRYDRETRYGFANDGNHCHRERTPRTINLDYQTNVCLNSAYLNCPIYLHSGLGTPVKPTKRGGKVIQAEGAPAARPQEITPVERTGGTAWTMLDDVEPAPVSGARKSLFSYAWFRLFFGLLLVVGSLSGMLLLVQRSGTGGVNANGGVATATPDNGIIIPVSTPTEVLPTDTPLPPTATEIAPTQTQTPTASPTATLTPTLSASETATETPTSTLIPTSTSPPFIPPASTTIPSPIPTSTKIPTPIPPTATTVPPTNTPVPPTNTSVPPSNTPVPPTNTPISDVPTNTPVP